MTIQTSIEVLVTDDVFSVTRFVDSYNHHYLAFYKERLLLFISFLKVSKGIRQIEKLRCFFIN